MNDNLEKNIYWVSKTMTSNKNDINALFPSARNVSAEATRAQSEAFHKSFIYNTFSRASIKRDLFNMGIKNQI